MRRARLVIAVLAVAAPAASEELPPVAARPPRAVEDASPPSPTVAERLAEIQRRVQRAASYPPIARARGIEGETLVSFEIGGEGLAYDVRALRSSGSGALDRAALRAVERAGVLPYVLGPVSVPVRFSLRDAN